MAKAISTKAASRPTAKPSAKAAPKTLPVAKAPAANRAPEPKVKAAPATSASANANPVKGASAKPAAPAEATRSKPASPSQPVKPTVVTLKHIVAELGDAHGLDPKAAHGVIAAVFQTVAARLKAGDKVRMDGFGVIEVKDRPARTGRNPGTGETIQIAASRKLVFRPAKELKAAV